MGIRSSSPLRLGAALALFFLILPQTACGRRGNADEGDSAAGRGDTADARAAASKSDTPGDAEEAVPVGVETLGRGRLESVLRFSTNLEAESEVRIVSQADRQLQVIALLAEEGSRASRGQVLLRLQDDQQRTALARVEGRLARARRDYERQTVLYEQQLISEQAFNEATYELDQLELALSDARRELAYTEVRSPLDGVITMRHVGVGDHVSPNQPLFDIVDFDSIVARVYVPERDLWRIRPGLEARLRAAAAGSEVRFGAVERIAPRVDPRSGTVKVTVAIPRGQRLLPGMYVTVELVTAVNEEALLVPKKALVYDAEQIFVFRLTGDQRVERLQIRPRLEDGENIEPVGDLATGDRIVVAGQAGLKNGSLVRLIRGEPTRSVAPRDAAGEPTAETRE